MRTRRAAIWGTIGLAVLPLACTDSSDTAAPVATPSPTTTGPSTPSTTTARPSTTTTSVPATTSTISDEVWPAAQWATTAPAEANLDVSKLAELALQAEAGGSDCLVVTHDGAIVAEWYWNGTDERSEREVFSVTKSITSTLVGIAQDRGLLDIDQPASDFIDEWVGTPSENVTIRNLVSNDSGRFQDFQTDYIRMAGQADDKTAFAIALEQQHAPGTLWVYNNAAIQTLEKVLERATGGDVGAFAEEVLFGPLAMDTSIIADSAGNTLTFMGAQASCRDLARFGLLYLRGGEWNGEQIVSAEWVAEATAPSTDLSTAYGYLWWLNRDGIVPAMDGVGVSRAGQLIPGAPVDMFAALGLGNQIVAVFPTDDLVVTRLGEPSGPDGAQFNVGTLATGLQAASAAP